MVNRYRGGVAILVLAGLAGCDNGGTQEAGGGGGAASATAALDACALLTAAEIGEAIGKPVEDGQAEMGLAGGATTAAMSSCVWSTPAAPVDPNNLNVAAALAGTMIVGLTVWSWPDGSGAEAFMQAFQNPAVQGPGALPAEAVAIGDQGLWSAGAPPLGGNLHVRNGEVTFTINITSMGTENPDTRAQSERLATTVLERI